jgi:hypothetical protein
MTGGVLLSAQPYAGIAQTGTQKHTLRNTFNERYEENTQKRTAHDKSEKKGDNNCENCAVVVAFHKRNGYNAWVNGDKKVRIPVDEPHLAQLTVLFTSPVLSVIV